jgi:hypothetical protein
VCGSAAGAAVSFSETVLYVLGRVTPDEWAAGSVPDALGDAIAGRINELLRQQWDDGAGARDVVDVLWITEVAGRPSFLKVLVEVAHGEAEPDGGQPAARTLAAILGRLEKHIRASEVRVLVASREFSVVSALPAADAGTGRRAVVIGASVGVSALLVLVLVLVCLHKCWCPNRRYSYHLPTAKERAARQQQQQQQQGSKGEGLALTRKNSTSRAILDSKFHVVVQSQPQPQPQPQPQEHAQDAERVLQVPPSAAPPRLSPLPPIREGRRGGGGRRLPAVPSAAQHEIPGQTTFEESTA